MIDGRTVARHRLAAPDLTTTGVVVSLAASLAAPRFHGIIDPARETSAGALTAQASRDDIVRADTDVHGVRGQNF